MKKRKLLCFLAFIILGTIALASCSKDVKATGTLEEEYVTRNTMCVTASVDDPEGEITSGSVQIGVYDDEGTKKTYQTCDKLPITDSEDDSQTVKLTSLEANTTYTVKLLCTIRDKQVTLAEKEISTNKLGTDSDAPILINSLEDLDKIKNDYSGYYRLENDLEVGTSEEYKEWTPLFSSSSSSAFTGTFDGNGHSIRFFKQTSSTSYYGFFGYLSSGSTVKNLTIESGEISIRRYSDSYIGMVAGCLASGATLENVSVKNCTIKVSTTATTSKLFYVGGAVGQNDCGTIKNVHVSKTVFDVTASKSLYLGGLVGQNDSNVDNVLSNSSADTAISINQTFEGTSIEEKTELLQLIGGLVGRNKNTGVIKNCVANTNITSKYIIKESTQKAIYGNKIEDDNGEAPAKDWKIENYKDNVAVGTFVGINSGVINTCASSGSIDFQSLSAYSVRIGLFCGADLQELEGLVKNVAYFNASNENTFNVKLIKEDLEGTEETKDKEPEYSRILNFGFAPGTLVESVYFEVPTLVLSASLENGLGESLSNYDNFGFTEEMLQFFKDLA